MNRKRTVVLAGGAFFAVAACAQSPEPGFMFFQKLGAEKAGFGTEAFSSGKIVKGAPYSAEESSESAQTLADGNRIVHKSTARVYRDKDGRTRTEKSFSVPGMASGEGEKVVMVNDAVLGVTYRLDPSARTAVKSPALNLQSDLEKQMIEKKIAEAKASGGNVLYTRAPAPNLKSESLGKQTIEGIEAEGTRTTTTIAAGDIGNERPIEIVSERWFAPALQTFVLTRRSDPMAGETIYRLSNISRADPDPSLFQVPAGYTVKEGAAARMGPTSFHHGEQIHIIKKEQ